MIRLSLATEPEWFDLEDGVRVKVRPLTTALWEAAKAKATRLSAELVGEHAEVQAAGGRVEGLPDLNDKDGIAGLSQFLFVKALAQSAILEWEGVLSPEADEPAVVNDETIGHLMMIHNKAERFIQRYATRYLAMVMEGNASGPLPNGTLVGPPTTATDAEPTDSPAQKDLGVKEGSAAVTSNRDPEV